MNSSTADFCSFKILLNIYFAGENERGEGYIITCIPKSLSAPHQSLVDSRYYIRAGSSFLPTPHSVLAGMFGRRPQPNVFQAFTVPYPEIIQNKIKITVSIILHNAGYGIAEDLFVNLTIDSIPGENCDIYFEGVGKDNWIGNVFLGRKINLISKKDVRLAPGAEISPIRLILILVPPIKENLKIKGICGCGQSPPYRFVVEKKSTVINKLCISLLEKHKNGLANDKEKSEFAKKIWDTKTERNFS